LKAGCLGVREGQVAAGCDRKTLLQGQLLLVSPQLTAAQIRNVAAFVATRAGEP